MARADPDQSRSRRKRPRRTAAVSFLVSLLLAELLVRAMFGVPLTERLPIMEIQANPARGWMMVPDEHHYTYQHRVEVNSLGLRGAKIETKDPAVTRVLCLGDSMIYGQGVADDETVPAYLESILNTRAGDGRRWQTVNAGHRAYGTHQELALVDELSARIAPDVVVLFWYWNDIEEPDIEGTHQRLQQSGRIAFDTGSSMDGWAWWRWQAKQIIRYSALVMAVHDLLRSPYMGTLPTNEALDQAELRQADYLDRFVVLSRETGFRLVIAIIPDANAVGVPEHRTKDVNTRLTELAEERQIPVIDLEEAVRAVTEELGRVPTIPFDGHYQPPANRAMAAAVAHSLLQ